MEEGIIREGESYIYFPDIYVGTSGSPLTLGEPRRVLIIQGRDIGSRATSGILITL